MVLLRIFLWVPCDYPRSCPAQLEGTAGQGAAARRREPPIREQVRQEQMRLEAFRQQTNSRLDRHDQVLQIDTAPRMESPLGLGGVAGTPPALPNGAQDDQRPIWFYVKGDNRCGPVSLGALRALLAGGEVNADSLFWRSGMSEWQPGRNVPEIRALFR